jgi:hypothetical protein
MLLPIVILGIVFIGIAFILNEKNSEYMLSGYNTMSPQERKDFNLKAFLSYFKTFHLFLGISFILICLCLFYLIDEDLAGLFMTFYPIVLYTFFIYKSQKFYSSTKGKRMAKVGVAIMLIIFTGIVLLLYTGYSENKISFDGNRLEISGIYGEDIAIQAIKKLDVVEAIPEITHKANGFALGSISKGYFGTKTEGRVKLILNTNKGPFLYILKSDGLKVYFSSTNQDVKKLLHEIESSILKKGN